MMPPAGAGTLSPFYFVAHSVLKPLLYFFTLCIAGELNIVILIFKKTPMLPKALLLALLLAFSSFLQAQKADKRFAGLDAEFARILKEQKAAGFSVAVVEKNKIIYAAGFGYADVENKIPATAETVYAIGSCTKAFTASIIGLLEKEGKLKLSDKVTKVLPELVFYNDIMNNQLSIRDIMCHRTGLPRYDYSWYLFQSKSRDSLLRRVQYQEPSVGIRELWQYNNFMFLAQGMIAEKITHESWEKNVTEKLLKPLQMTHTNFSVDTLAKLATAAKGYNLYKNKIKKSDYYPIAAMGPAGSINSSVNDMGNWVITWINGGKYKGAEIIPASYIKDASSAQMLVGSSLPSKQHADVHSSAYGLGWFVASYRSHYRVEHGGNIDGFSASTSFFPTDSIGIIVLCNQNGSRVPSTVRNIIADRMLQLPKVDWQTETQKDIDSTKQMAEKAKQNVVSNRKMNTQPSHALNEYDGLYNNNAFGVMDIRYKKDSLILYTNSGNLWLKHYQYDQFELYNIDKTEGIDTTTASDVKLQFNTTALGDIGSLQISLEPAMEKPSVFTKTSRKKELTAGELEKFAGTYSISGVDMVVAIKKNVLTLTVPGQPEYTLVAASDNKFALSSVEGFFVEFKQDDKGKVTELLSIQPNGTFKALKK
jgi:CubicO group peptidase (beta-lactamase class C family)